MHVHIGPKYALLDFSWHPFRTFSCACTVHGPMQIWGTDINWAAFAPEFEEIEENEEYVEKEDEFDVVDGKQIAAAARQQTQEDLCDGELDVVTVEKPAAFDSDDDSCNEDAAFHIPVRIGQAHIPHSTNGGTPRPFLDPPTAKKPKY